MGHRGLLAGDAAVVVVGAVAASFAAVVVVARVERRFADLSVEGVVVVVVIVWAGRMAAIGIAVASAGTQCWQRTASEDCP